VPFTVLRVQQDRYIANLLGHYDLTDNLTFFTEGLYAKVKNASRRNPASANSAGSNTIENGALVLNINNPFLDTADRAALAASGITAAVNNGNFVVSRTNQDIFGDNPFTNESETYRIVGGLRGDFGVFGRKLTWEVSATYGSAKQVTKTKNIKDIEYALAIDTVLDGGVIKCRSQVTGIPATLPGIAENLIAPIGADGLPRQQLFTPTATAAQVAACQPLNPFGFDQMTRAAKDYVIGNVEFNNSSSQLFIQSFVSGSPFDLPAGELGLSVNAEYRREKLNFVSDEFNRLGRFRTAPSAQTSGTITAYEGGAEARIPLLGGDFTLPFLGSLEVNPAVRFSKQNGSAPSFRNLAGGLVTQTAKGKTETIWSIGGLWRPIPDITLRGNVTRSIRQPGIVELFLGGQPAFATPTDPCSNQNITGGPVPTTRRANCQADVIARGLATDAVSAGAFLNSFVANGLAVQGTFAGSPTLSPEKGRSKTAGIVLAPRFIPNLSLSADYISLDLRNVIQPTNLVQAQTFCYDSATYPDTTPQLGSNTCGFFVRDAAFQVTNGFSSGFLNLSATKIRAININGRYSVELPSDLGKLILKANAYHLIKYDESAAGDFKDTQSSAGTFNRPKWETQLTTRYEKGGFYSQLVWNWRDKTQVFSGGVPATIELVPNFNYPSVNTFDATVGADVNDNFRLQLVVTNLTDKTFVGEVGFFNAAYFDQIGRRFQVAATMKF
jgi:outer membrane receptor protein involved in Fe transport